MYCHKCGSEILSNGASFCMSCGEPLAKSNPSSDEKPPDTESSNKNQDPLPTSVNLEFGDGEEALRMSDPIDFLMQEEQEEPPPPESPKGEISTDKFNTVDDGDMESLIGGAGAGSAAEEDSPETPVEQQDRQPQQQPPFQNQSQPPQFQEQQSQPQPAKAAIDTMQKEPEKPEEEEIPPLMEVPPEQDFNQGENIVATSKIKVDDVKKNETNKFDTSGTDHKTDISLYQKPKRRSDHADLDMARIKKSSMIAYVSGNNLTLTGGPKISAGDEIQVGDNTYEVRQKPKDKNNLYAMIGSVVLAIFVTLYFLGAFSGGSRGSLAGIVVGSDNRPISNQEVRVKETGKKMLTNMAGFFWFNNLPVGTYTIEYLIDDEVVGAERITVLGDKTSTVKLSESELEPISSVEPPPPRSRSSPVAEKKTESSSVASSKPDKNEPGTLKLALRPSGVRSYLDGKPMGVGSNSYRVRPGKYLLSVKKSGYKAQSKNITVRPRKTISYSFTLKKETTRPQKTDLEIAQENETAGRYQEALTGYKKILRKNPKDIDALLGKGRCLRSLNEYESALSSFTEAGRIAAAKDDTRGQYDALTEMIEMKPNSFTIYLARGDVSYSTGDYSRAADDYARVIALDKRNLKTYYKLGNSFYKDGRYNDAVQAFKGAEELNFADPRAQYYLALTYHALDDKKNTKKAYRKFKELASYSTAIEFEKAPEWKKVLEYLEVEN